MKSSIEYPTTAKQRKILRDAKHYVITMGQIGRVKIRTCYSLKREVKAITKKGG